MEAIPVVEAGWAEVVEGSAAGEVQADPIVRAAAADYSADAV